jgi:toxin ParE1/3/4
VKSPFEILWTAFAQADLDDTLEYVAVRDGYTTAERLCGKLLRRIDGLAAHPLRCRAIPELRDLGLLEYRELIVSPYRVCFRIRGRKVFLLGVLDGRRDLAELLLRRVLSS